jgi:hypothetical protein
VPVTACARHGKPMNGSSDNLSENAFKTAITLPRLNFF